MTYHFADGQIGYPPIEAVLPVQTTIPPNPFWDRSFIAVASDPVWGCGEFVFGQISANIRPFGLCSMLEVWDATNKIYTMNFTESVSSATPNLGSALYVFAGNQGGVTGATVAASAGMYGWFMMAGRIPVNGSATLAAGVTAGRTGAGQIGGNTAGVQVLNAKVVTPATQTVVAATAGLGATGDTQIQLASVQGFFPGVYVSGTGVGAAAICTSVDPISKIIQVSVVNSAQVSGNVTATYNNGTIFYNVLAMNRSFAQGAIT
jgi:hypothetical protein